jgi:bifunctional DNase/RNase
LQGCLDLLSSRAQNIDMSNPNEELQVEIKGLMLDPSSNVPIVILRDIGSQLFLPIWIGVFEANAIALRLEGVEPPRPMTHDLLRSLLEQLGGRVEKIVISDLRESTFFAMIHVHNHDRTVEVDARPSDAIALALRTGSPIFVLRSVLDKAQAVDLAAEATDEDKLKKWLEEISPDELGKWTM